MSEKDKAQLSHNEDVDVVYRQSSRDATHASSVDERAVTTGTDNPLENPLQRLTKDELLKDIDSFCSSHRLMDHHDLFRKAALVAQSPDDYNNVTELTADDKDALDYERNHKWAGTKQMYYTVFVCALGAATQGWDQTGSNGANLSFPQEFGIGAAFDEVGGQRDEWIVGLINSIPYLAAGLIGVWLSDPLNKYLGRRGEISFTAAILVATPIASGFARNWVDLFISRLFMGIGMGAKNATVPVFSAEMAPARIRGALVMGWQLWVCFGIFLGFAANVVVKDIPVIAWRLQLGSAFIPALPLMITIFWCPESPRWLMKRGNYPKAFRSYLRLRRHPIIAARDLYYSHYIYQEEVAMAQGTTYISRLLDCFRVPRIRRANLAGSTVMLAQQMCGINIISFYSSTVFVESGSTESEALFASLGFGAVNFLFAVPALFLIDRFGRRSLLLSTFPFMVLFLLATGLAFLMPRDAGSGRLALIAAFIYLFTAFYSVGEGPVCFPYSAEVFPTVQREQGMAFTVAINSFFAGVLGLTFPRLLRTLSPTGAFGFYAGLNLVALIWIFSFVPETKRLTLEELDQVFSVPTPDFAKHEWTEWLPWFIKRYVFFQKSAVKPAPIVAVAREY